MARITVRSSKSWGWEGGGIAVKAKGGKKEEWKGVIVLPSSKLYKDSLVAKLRLWLESQQETNTIPANCSGNTQSYFTIFPCR